MPTILTNEKIKLLIADSTINHYKAEYAGHSKLPEKIQRLNKSYITEDSKHHHQMQSSVDGTYSTVVPLGGDAMSYTSKYRIHLDGRNNDRRRARLERSPSRPQSDIYFAIDKQRGFTDIEDD
jgi:DNA repair protein RadA